MFLNALSASAQRKFVEEACSAVRSLNLLALRVAVTTYGTLLGRDEIERLFDEEVPQALGPDLTRVMHQMMSQADDGFCN